MIGQETRDVERKTRAILEVLRNSPQPLGGRVLAHRLSDLGIDLGERAVRYHLELMDERGFTQIVGRKEGRAIIILGIGDHVFKDFIENTKIEWDNYRIRVTDYELTRYLPIL